MKRSAQLLLLLSLLLLSACNVVRGSGDVISEERQVSGFTGLSLSGQGELFLTQGEGQALRIEAEDNIIAAMEIEVRGDTLTIGFKSGTLVNNTEPILFYVTMDEITSIDIAGSGEVTAESVIGDDLQIDIGGSGRLRIASLEANSVRTSIGGSGAVTLSGAVAAQSVDIGGSGTYAAGDLQSERADITIGGSGNATVTANETLDADIGGSGSVSYYGNPSVNSNVSGSGNVTALER